QRDRPRVDDLQVAQRLRRRHVPGGGVLAGALQRLGGHEAFFLKCGEHEVVLADHAAAPPPAVLRSGAGGAEFSLAMFTTAATHWSCSERAPVPGLAPLVVKEMPR